MQEINYKMFRYFLDVQSKANKLGFAITDGGGLPWLSIERDGELLHYTYASLQEIDAFLDGFEWLWHFKGVGDES